MSLYYDKDKDEWVFPSGNRIYAHTDIVGIQWDGGWALSYGYDGGLDLSTYDEQTDGPIEFPNSDKIALADEMISRWTKYKESLK